MLIYLGESSVRSSLIIHFFVRDKYVTPSYVYNLAGRMYKPKTRRFAKIRAFFNPSETLYAITIYIYDHQWTYRRTSGQADR